jgi:DNA-binding CsgD family transcriptional regulator
MGQSRPLTKREIEVLGLLAQGHTARRAGEFLGITPRTVSAHTQSIVSKLGTQNCTHAVAVAVRNGLIRP